MSKMIDLPFTPEDVRRAAAAKARVARYIDDAEMLRLAKVALQESQGAPVTQDWQEAALMVCRELVSRS
jgi:hypothetical protein